MGRSSTTRTPHTSFCGLVGVLRACRDAGWTIAVMMKRVSGGLVVLGVAMSVALTGCAAPDMKAQAREVLASGYVAMASGDVSPSEYVDGVSAAVADWPAEAAEATRACAVLLSDPIYAQKAKDAAEALSRALGGETAASEAPSDVRPDGEVPVAADAIADLEAKLAEFGPQAGEPDIEQCHALLVGP